MYQTDSTYSQEDLRNYFRELACDFNFKTFPKKRNKEQNKFYWGYVIQPLSDFLKTPKQDVHEVLKHQFLVNYKIVETQSGERIMPYVKSTTTLTGAEFETYCHRIRDWALTEL